MITKPRRRPSGITTKHVEVYVNGIFFGWFHESDPDHNVDRSMRAILHPGYIEVSRPEEDVSTPMNKQRYFLDPKTSAAIE